MKFVRLLAALAGLGIVPAAMAGSEKWAEAIDKFTAEDRQHPPPRNAVVFIGSSSIVLWPLAQSFPEVAAVNRGFGGSEMSDSAYYADRIVIPYHPRIVVVYAGENDLAAGKTPETILADFRAFRAKIHAALPETKVIYLAIKLSCSRYHLREPMRRANLLLAADCGTDSRCQFVDVATPILDEQGNLREELYQDSTHLGPAGYAIWTRILAPYLEP